MDPKSDARAEQEHPSPDSFERYDGPDHATPDAADEQHRRGDNPPSSAGKPPY